MKHALSFLTLAAALLGVGCSPSTPEGTLEGVDEDENAIASEKFAVDISLWSGEVTDSEMRCWWDGGVRHVIVGTQNPRISRQQLDMALDGGMTVDLYVYLYWNIDMKKQVADALALAAEYPEVGRLWLDVEENPGGIGVTALKTKLHDALDACGNVECGIYTGKGFWTSYMGNTSEFSSVPLWYAWYDLDPSTSTWSTQKFGGWAAPTAKQWQETYYCGIDVDKNTMIVDAEPEVTPTPFAADGPGAPAAPVGMYPDDLRPIETDSVRMLVETPQLGVTKYAFEVQYWTGTKWSAYYTYSSTKPAVRFNPTYKNKAYRFRARAMDGSGWGAWSHWGEWAQGKPTSLPPSSQMDPVPGSDPGTDPGTPPPPPPPPPPSDGSPTGLTPADGSTITTASVALGCTTVAGATEYAFEIEHQDPATSTYKAYYTYTGSSAARTFYPQYANRSYRFRVRARVNGTWTPSSAWSGFYFD